MRSLANIFADTLLSSLPVPNDGSILTAMSTDLLEDAVTRLANRNIQSTPVIDGTVPENAPWWDRYIGVLDMIQVMQLVVSMDQSHSEEELEQFLTTHTVSQLFTHDEDGVTHLPMDCTLLDAMFMISQYNARRICIVDATTCETPSSNIHNFLSPSTILAQISECCERGHVKMGNIRIRDTHLDIPGLHGVLSVKMTDPVMSAFDLMDRMRITALAIVGDRGEVIGKVSATDVFALFRDHKILARVLSKTMTVGQYQQWRLDKNVQERALLTCRSHDRLEDVIHRMVAARTRRTFVVDERGVPTGVVSIRDIIRVLVPDIVDMRPDKQKESVEADSDEFALNSPKA